MMNTTTVANNSCTVMAVNTTSPKLTFTEPYRTALITIYTIVLLVGTMGLTLMMNLLKSNIRSITTIAFLNLMVAHFLFLLTVPFRIYYYASTTWRLSHGFCKVVSAMIHIHMYMVFTIYTIVLTIRFLHFYKKTQRTEFYRRLHAVCASALIWSVLLPTILPTVLSHYGKMDKKKLNTTENQCFIFGDMLQIHYIYVLNMIVSIVIVVVSCIQTCIQAIILRTMILKYGPASRSQQDFWVQMKNLCFLLIMLTCLVPYHLFRFHYLKHNEELHEINEVFLAITALTCFDMLTFTGKGFCKVYCRT
ncbi:probable G-protein coupled receptor 141 [Myxocyprinus asiaticus]|uniref:probable G-protein coupled receptor 141 n=1 Tax=Myxocyprinus asiaticus TaxID=70543 RepID=UPI002221D540|nr:probable G-protein coupled receptor 141 [Myxocyprinus asiaticus]XP_051542671.1 probable G-protein coupled receptor 141 [Myxocyprinus asiaticus]XP_051542672.1 probable G-protein coupled receptor 141 [Myxocyprinus asiaticus]